MCIRNRPTTQTVTTAPIIVTTNNAEKNKAATPIIATTNNADSHSSTDHSDKRKSNTDHSNDQ